jgi:hypothetical protein
VDREDLFMATAYTLVRRLIHNWTEGDMYEDYEDFDTDS